MTTLTWVVLALICVLCDLSSAYKKRPVETVVRKKNTVPLIQTWQWNPNHYWYHNHYKHKKKRVQYPRIKGRCKPPPTIKINGTDIIGEETQKGNVVVLALSKRSCSFCIEQLGSLNNHARYFKQEKMNVSIVVLNHRWYPMSGTAKQFWRNIKIYNEPKKSRVFKKLGGSYGDFLIYDKCKRQQYLIRRPYSWLGYPFLRSAVRDTHYFFETLCGECEPEPEVGPENPDAAPTTKRPVTTKTTKPISNINGPDETAPEETVDNTL